MIIRTHLAFAALIIILFVQQVSHPVIFMLMVIVATVIPDLDSAFSSWGRHLIFRPLQFFISHRGLVHSLTTAFILSVLLAIFWPVASLGFFMGYSVHLIVDSFTKEGVQAFWPLKGRTYGPIRSGGRLESSIFIFLIIFDVALAISVFLF